MHKLLFLPVFGVFVAVFVACGDDASSSAGGAAAGGASGSGGHAEGGASGDPTVLVGAFQIELHPPVDATAGTTSVTGKLYDGSTPANLIWEAGTKDGDCQLFTPRVPFCNTPCGGSAVCVEDDTCKDYPTAHDAGVITVTGLAKSDGAGSFTMSPIANNYQVPAGVTLAYPAFAEGDAISLDAAGGYFGAFRLEASGVAPLALEGSAAIPLDPTSGATIAWTPPSDASGSQIHAKLDISHHGGTKGMITCDTADSGALTISGALVSELLDLGVAGYPTIVLTRSNTGSTVIESGRVDLVVGSSVERSVSISGLTSCTSDTDCPDGQTCQTDLTCM